MYNKYKTFDLKTFKKEFESGDLCGLEYLEKTIITEMKKQIEENNKKRTYALYNRRVYNKPILCNNGVE